MQQSYAEKTGKKITLKDVHNIATRMKASNSVPPAAAAKGLYDWLKEEHPSLYCDFVVKEEVLCGIYMQDAEMLSTFQRFPEVLLCDSTYKTNNANMALYVLIAIDGHSESQVVATFLLSSEDKLSLQQMIAKFKEKNENWSSIKCVITDKDMTERSVFKGEMSQVEMQICLFHTLRTFSREVTIEKMKITSTQKIESLNMLEKLAYAADEETYTEVYEDFVQKAPLSVLTYFNKNWHEIKKEWVRGLKSFHLQNDTTNRVESFFSHLKKYFHPRSTLKDMIGGLLSCIEAHRSERRYRQARSMNRLRTASHIPSGFQQQYNELLTPFAYDCLCTEIRNMDRSDRSYGTTEDSCSCRFFRCMMLPCRHILSHRRENALDLFLLDGVARRWTRQYNNDLNVRPLSHQLQSSVSQATPRKKKKTLSTNEKFKLAQATALEMVTMMAEEGMDDFNKKHGQLKQLLAKWKEDSQFEDIQVAETVRDENVHQEEQEENDVQEDETHEVLQENSQENNTPEDAVQEDETHDVPQNSQENSQPSPNLDGVSLPHATKKRGRPKGSNRSVIGLP